MDDSKYIVRLYDGFDYEWIDVSKPVNKEEADRIWNEYTSNGTIKTTYNDIDYYKIFKADCVMLYSRPSGRYTGERISEPKPYLYYKHCVKCGMDFQSPKPELVNYMFLQHLHDEHSIWD